MVSSIYHAGYQNVVDKLVSAWQYNGESWNIKQILANIDIIIPVEDR